MLRSAWLTYKMHRFEVLAVGGAAGRPRRLASGSSPGTSGTPPSLPSCWTYDDDGNLLRPGCRALMDRFYGHRHVGGRTASCTASRSWCPSSVSSSACRSWLASSSCARPAFAWSLSLRPRSLAVEPPAADARAGAGRRHRHRLARGEPVHGHGGRSPDSRASPRWRPTGPTLVGTRSDGPRHRAPGRCRHRTHDAGVDAGGDGRRRLERGRRCRLCRACCPSRGPSG